MRLNSKNQVVIPKEIRRILGIKAGDKILFIPGDGIVYLLPQSTSRVDILKGITRRKLSSLKKLKGSLSGLPTVGFREKNDRI